MSSKVPRPGHKFPAALAGDCAELKSGGANIYKCLTAAHPAAAEWEVRRTHERFVGGTTSDSWRFPSFGSAERLRPAVTFLIVPIANVVADGVCRRPGAPESKKNQSS